MICEANMIEQRLTKPNKSLTNGKEERMDRYGDAPVKRVGDSLHYHSRPMTRGDAIIDVGAQFVRYMIKMKIA
jgi:hypothetical protein